MVRLGLLDGDCPVAVPGGSGPAAVGVDTPVQPPLLVTARELLDQTPTVNSPEGGRSTGFFGLEDQEGPNL